MASWFDEHRYGLFVHASIASVPAFAPVGQYAEWYWSHLSPEPLADVLLHPAPMPEVLDWHRRQYGPDVTYDDLLPQLTFEGWDADAIAALAVEAGMGYVVHVVKHHDGFCWWDSAHTERTSARHGPGRDVVAELADACRRAGLVYGTYYSLLDWAHPAYPDQAGYVDGFLRPQLAELVERHRPSVLWGDGHWGHPGGHWRSDEIVADYRSVVPDGLVNDRWGLPEPDFTTYEYTVPVEPPAGRFEVCRGLAHSFGYNRAEREQDHLTPTALVALLSETVAKGGNLLVNVGLQADGTVPEVQARVLREAGRWVRANDQFLRGAPFDVWGDERVRSTVTRTPEATVVNVVDVVSSPAVSVPGLGHDRWQVQGVAAGLWTQGPTSFNLKPDRPRLDDLGTTYEVRVRERGRSEAPAVAEPEPTWVRLGDRELGSVEAALAEARPGDVVEVGPGRHDVGPLEVGEGVTLRGRGATLVGGRSTGAVVVLAGHGATVEDLTILGGRRRNLFVPPTTVLGQDVDGVVVRECRLPGGGLVLRGGRGARIEGNRLLGGGGMLLRATVGAVVRDNRLVGDRWGVGILDRGGTGTVIAGNRLHDHLCGVRLVQADAATLADNEVQGRWWGLHLEGCRRAVVASNRVSDTMRAVCVSGGEQVTVSANRLERCDSGVLLEGGTAGVRLVANLVADCRVGVMVWDGPGAVVDANRIVDNREADVLQQS